jgi:hypothetical protein
MTAADTIAMTTTTTGDTGEVPTTDTGHSAGHQAHALHTVADLVSTTAIDGLSITVYDTSRISIQVSTASGPLHERLTRLSALADAFDTVTAPATRGGPADHPSIALIEAEGTLAGHRIDVFTTDQDHHTQRDETGSSHHGQTP